LFGRKAQPLITIVLLNWLRPKFAISNIEHYARYPLVHSILCFDNAGTLKGQTLPEKCILIESSRDLGLYSRFAAGALAKTDAIFHKDDYLYLPEDSLELLFDAWTKAPQSCHGIFGRDVAKRYTGTRAYGRVEVLLTRAVICGRGVNNHALSNTIFFEDLRGQPDGNGEDIILSFAAMELAGELNYAHNLPVIEHSDGWRERAGPNSRPIHLRWPDHHAHRTQVVERARKLLRAKLDGDSDGHQLRSQN
jgi:hypothetical protein